MADVSYEVKLDGDGFGQPTSATCWYASYALLHKWKERPISSIRERIVKAGLPYADYCQNGLPQEDFRKTRNALGLVSWHGQYAFSRAEDYENWVYLLKSHGPLWCAFKRPGAHVVVVVGVDGKLETIHILNPWNNTVGSNADSQYLKVSVFKNRVNSDVSAALQSFL